MLDNTELELHKISEFENGTIKRLLLEAYKKYHEKYPIYLDENNKSFDECNDFFYENISIGDNCCVISTYKNETIGMCCWDPRQFPLAIIGHNCILPKYQGNGFGEKQLKQVVDKLRGKGFIKVQVSTGILDFYVPAQRQYQSIGFKETIRDEIINGEILQSSMIYYEMIL
jgi:GNAT superfamily N-acetyltransferase